MPGKRSILATNPQQRPHDLDRKYRKLAIPAVVAALAADRRGKQVAPKDRDATQDRDRKG